MAEDQAENVPEPVQEGEEEPDAAVGYKTPAAMSTSEILSKDTEDESLRRYKEQLLGQAASGKAAIHDADNPSRMIGKSMALVVKGREDVEIDLKAIQDAKKSKAKDVEKSFTIKEGCEYQIRINFWVQREIVTGLKYVQLTYRKGLRVDKTSVMMGSYSPQDDAYTYTTKVTDAPEGMIARGHYSVKSKFTDDDGHDYAEWSWDFHIKKEWDN